MIPVSALPFVSTLAQVHPVVTSVLVAFFLFICVLLVLVVLIQRPAGGGLSGAFGSGAGSGQTAFGAKTGDALTIATIAIFTIYLLFAIGLNFATRPPGPSRAPTTAQQPAGGVDPNAPATGDQPPAPSTPETAPTTPPSAAPATPAAEQPAAQPSAATPPSAPETTPPNTTPPAAAPPTAPEPEPAPAGNPG